MDEGRKSPELANLFRKVYGATTSLQGVLEIGRDVEGLAGHPGWAHVENLLTALREKRLEDLLVAEKPLEQADYSYRIGVLKGTEAALYAVETIATVAQEVRVKLEKDIESQEAAR
jgi:hypothetical protein